MRSTGPSETAQRGAGRRAGRGDRARAGGRLLRFGLFHSPAPPATTTVRPPQLHGATYTDEAARVERPLASGDGLADLNAMQFAFAAIFVVHSHIMHAVREWAPAHG